MIRFRLFDLVLAGQWPVGGFYYALRSLSIHKFFLAFTFHAFMLYCEQQNEGADPKQLNGAFLKKAHPDQAVRAEPQSSKKVFPGKNP
jgi:hypothetical protein